MKCIHLIVSAALLVLFILASTACGGTAEIKTKANSSTGAADENPSITAGEAIPANIDAVPAFPELRFDSPVYITWVPGGQDRLAVLEQQGVIRVFSDTDSASETETFLDIRDKVHAGGEEGLLGLAFDPGFKDNGRFYVYYSASSPRRSVLSRLTIKSDGSGSFWRWISHMPIITVAT
jgi:glucose/arabinose dehydrogenase